MAKLPWYKNLKSYENAQFSIPSYFFIEVHLFRLLTWRTIELIKMRLDIN